MPDESVEDAQRASMTRALAALDLREVGTATIRVDAGGDIGDLGASTADDATHAPQHADPGNGTDTPEPRYDDVQDDIPREPSKYELDAAAKAPAAPPLDTSDPDIDPDAYKPKRAAVIAMFSATPPGRRMIRPGTSAPRSIAAGARAMMSHRTAPMLRMSGLCAMPLHRLPPPRRQAAIGGATGTGPGVDPRPGGATVPP